MAAAGPTAGAILLHALTFFFAPPALITLR